MFAVCLWPTIRPLPQEASLQEELQDLDETAVQRFQDWLDGKPVELAEEDVLHFNRKSYKDFEKVGRKESKVETWPHDALRMPEPEDLSDAGKIAEHYWWWMGGLPGLPPPSKGEELDLPPKRRSRSKRRRRSSTRSPARRRTRRRTRSRSRTLPRHPRRATPQAPREWQDARRMILTEISTVPVHQQGRMEIAPWLGSY